LNIFNFYILDGSLPSFNIPSMNLFTTELIMILKSISSRTRKNHVLHMLYIIIKL